MTVFSPVILPGEYRSRLVFRLNRMLVLAELRRLVRREGRVTFLTNTPFSEHLVGPLRPDRVVYDVIDDFAAFDWAPAGGEAMERRLLDAAGVVFTGTRSLLEKVRPRREDAVYIPCGVDFDAFAQPDTLAAGTGPADIRSLPRPLIGYVGTLGERIDTGVLEALARRVPQASIVLIGPVHGSYGPAPEGENIHYRGLKRHDELAASLHRCQVALLPFRLTDAGRAVNPVKTLEYLAAGCVVVSTRIPDVERFYSGVVLIADSPDEFAEKVAGALCGSNTERVRAGVERARAATWGRMVKEMERRMGEL